MDGLSYRIKKQFKDELKDKGVQRMVNDFMKQHFDESLKYVMKIFDHWRNRPYDSLFYA